MPRCTLTRHAFCWRKSRADLSRLAAANQVRSRGRGHFSTVSGQGEGIREGFPPNYSRFGANGLFRISISGSIRSISAFNNRFSLSAAGTFDAFSSDNRGMEEAETRQSRLSPRLIRLAENRPG